MNINEAIKKLNGTQIKLEEIAKKTYTKNYEEFQEAFAQEVVRQRLKSSGLIYHKFCLTYPYTIGEDKEISVRVFSGEIADSKNKNAIESAAAEINEEMMFSEGIICFLPFQMNGNKTRTIISNKVKDEETKRTKIGFVNLPYNEKSLRNLYVKAGNYK